MSVLWVQGREEMKTDKSDMYEGAGIFLLLAGVCLLIMTCVTFCGKPSPIYHNGQMTCFDCGEKK